MKTFRRWLTIVGITVLVTVAVIMFPTFRKAVTRRTGQPVEVSQQQPPSSGGIRFKSARQLLSDRALALHPRNDHIEVDSGFYGGAYQVTVWTASHTFIYVAEVDERSQKITAWELKH